MGDALGNAGFVTRGVFENVGYNAVNFSRGSDLNNFLATPSNWTYRKELMVLANPSYVINENIHNDLANNGGAATNWAATTTYSQYSVVIHSGNEYLATAGGLPARQVRPGRVQASRMARLHGHGYKLIRVARATRHRIPLAR
jgi:hypothetical protein